MTNEAIISLYLVKSECAYLLLVAVGHRAVGAGLSNSDLQDGSFIVGTGQKDQVILKVKQSNNTELLGEH